jgi:thiol:disulfide interchange protein DsbD
MSAKLAITPAAGGVTQPSFAAEAASGPRAEPFTTARYDALLKEGKPFFMNLTAAWCITCKVNERVALSSHAIAEAFERGRIAYLKGDWTTQNPEITAVLRQFGRAGVPLYVFYPGGGQQPRVLPQLLTESIVLDQIRTRTAAPKPSAKGA